MADRGRSRALGTARYAALAVGLLVLTVYGSIIPLRYHPIPYEEAVQRYRDARLYDATLAWARGDWAVNAVQYALLSFCAAAALSVDLKWVFRLGAAAVVVPLGFLAASWIEFLQIYFPPRTVSVNDVMVERAGVVAGAMAWVLAGQPLTGMVRRFWEAKGPTGLARQAMPLYVALLAVGSLMPFDFVLGPGELSQKAREGRIVLVPFSSIASGGLRGWLGLAANLAAFAPLGVLGALLRRGGPIGGAAMLGTALGVALAIEAGQLLVYTRYCDVTDVASGTAAAMLGWWAASSVRDRRAASRLGGLAVHDGWAAARSALARGDRIRWLAGASAGAWVLLLVAASWQPYDFSTDPTRFRGSDAELSDEDTRVLGLRRFSWAPFVDYYWGSRYNALDQFATRSLAFAPIGVALAVAFGKRERLGSSTTLVVATTTAAVIEAGQYFIPDRHPGTTDLMIQVFGAWLGYRLSRHVAHAFETDRESLGEARYRYGFAAAAGSAGSAGRRPPAGASAGRIRRLVGEATGRLGDSVVPRFEALPYPAKLAALGVAAALVSVALVLIAGRLGLL